jgi:hypothetical protein
MRLEDAIDDQAELERGRQDGLAFFKRAKDHEGLREIIPTITGLAESISQIHRSALPRRIQESV